MATELRIGQGIDIHQLVEGRPLVLGGVSIPHEKGLLGHSDADVVLHAVIDAILGATGRADIGTYFPNTDERWRGASSIELLKAVMTEVKNEGWSVVNVDVAVMAEAPKLAPYIPQMKARIAETLSIPQSSCAVKATTAEKLGAIGRGEGIFAQSVVLMQRV